MMIAARFTALVLALSAALGAFSIVASSASAQAPAPAGAQSPFGFAQPEFDDLATRASEAVDRCDRREALRLIGLMRRNAQSLATAAATAIGTRQMRADALRLTEIASSLSKEREECDQQHTAAAIDAGQSYGFYTMAAAEAVEGYMKDAEAAATNCREDQYGAAVAGLREFANALDRAASQNPSSAKQYRRDATNARKAADDLVKTKDARFAHCAKKEEPKKTSMAPAAPPVPGRPGAPILDQQLAMMLAMFASNALYGEAALGIGRTTFGEGSASYASTGAQAPFAGDGRGQSATDFCGELSFWYALALTLNPNVDALLRASQPHFGLAVSVCTASARTAELYSIERHGPGRVLAQLKEFYTITLLVQARLVLWFQPDWLAPPRYASGHGRQMASRDELFAQASSPSRQPWPIALTVGVGPSFVRGKLTLTSDQSFFGGGVPSASDTRTDTGITFRMGASTALCVRCAFGQPVMLGVDGTFTWLPSRELSLTSPAFGITETARLGARMNSSVIFKVSVPFGLSRR